MDGHLRLLVHAGGEVSRMPADVNFEGRIQARHDTVLAVGVENLEIPWAVVFQIVMEEVIELANRDLVEV